MMGLILDYIEGERPDAHQRLLKVIRSVRRRWRLKVAVRGLAIAFGVGLMTLLLASLVMDYFRFDGLAVSVLRVLSYVVVIGVAIRFLLLPLFRRVPDERVALYLEEGEPSLEAGVVSAIEFGDREEPLIRKTVEAAIEKCAAVEFGRRVEKKSLARSSGLLAGASVVALILMMLAPPFLRTGGSYLLFPISRSAVENPYSISVAPGDARVARGGDLRVTARLQNFDSDDVIISVRRGEAAEWESWSMNRDEDGGGFLFFLFDLDERTEYVVEASGVRSPVFTVEVSDLPYVETLVLEYRFPAYTGLEPRVQEDNGDIAALKGTEVRLTVTPTLPVAGGAVVVEHGDTLPLALAEQGTLTGSIEVREESLYRIVFDTRDGSRVAGSPDYLIDVLEDQPPYVSFSKPGRDVKVTNIDEVFIEAQAEDDYGVRRLALVYSVNGAAERTIELYAGSRREISAGHTIYLEEMELVPGDFVSYYARAADANRVDGAQGTTTDIYFIEIRPFDREFRQADQSGQGGAAPFNSALSQQQRQIIAATFKMIRDRETYSESEFEENLATLALAQGRLRQQVETLVRRIQTRGVTQRDSTFQVIAEALPQAAEEMHAAEEQLGRADPDSALPPEQRALQKLQRAESMFREFQVGSSQGGGGGGEVDAEELAELFELELDRMRNQYERVERDRQQEVDNAIDETMQKLQELARRQQQENERMRAQANRQRGSGGGGANQRQLAEEAEELARKLERLAREQSLPELNETARELQRAAESMRRSAAGADEEGVAQGLAALERLREARRRLDRNKADRLENEIDDALGRARRLAEQQREVMEDVEGLDRGGDRNARVERISERKEQMAGEVADLEAQIDRLSREARSEQRDASRKLQEAANSIRDSKLEDMIRYSQGVVQQRSGEYARQFEEQIAERIDELTENIEAASEAMGETREQRIARSLERTRDLVRSLESLDERIDRSGEQEAGEATGEREGGAEGTEARPDGGDATPEGGGGPPSFRSGDVRQFRREFRERRGEAERLRDELRREGVETSDLDRAIEQLNQLEERRIFTDPRGLDELQAAVIQGLKEFEFALRRQLDGDPDRPLLLTGSDEVPEGYRDLVEEYYKALAESGREGDR